MVKEFRVFFSWQADLPSNQTKRFIENCIEVAKNKLSNSISLILDEATRNMFGSPDIMESIFDKIAMCDLFIADVSIVGSYAPTKSKDDESIEQKFFPNPNVVLELGYASGIITWDRCICLANTKYGEPKQLPFDLNHRRVTTFSYAEGDRKSEINRIAEIIINTVIEYANKPLPKKDFSNHLVGGFNFKSNTINAKLIPFNQVSFDCYNAHSQELLAEIKTLVDKISDIHLPSLNNQEDTSVIIPPNISTREILDDSVLSEKSFIQLFTNNVEVDKQNINQLLKKYLNVELSEDFYYIGNLKQYTIIRSQLLDGTEIEKIKYEYIQDLELKLMDIDFRQKYAHIFNDALIFPLAIQNISTKNDKRITINIKIIQGIPIQPTSDFFISELKGQEGYAYDLHLAQEILSLPENNIIKHDSSSAVNPSEIYTPVIKSYMSNLLDTPASDFKDYEQELQDYIQESNPGYDNEYSFTIGELRPQETVWLGKVLLIKPVDNNVVIKYSIKSKNTTGDISEILSYKTE